MITNKYITRSCKIESGIVHLDSEQVFADPQTSVPAFLLSVYQHFALGYPKFYKMDNLSKLGWLAAELLLRDTSTSENYEPEQVAIVMANANSSLDNDLKYMDTIADGASPSVFVYTLPNIVIGEICIRHKFKGEHAFFIQEEFDARFIIQQTDYLFENGLASACICGWVDVLGDSYKAVLYLVENNDDGSGIAFSAESMESLFNSNN